VTDVEVLVLNNDERLEVLEDNFEQARGMILFMSSRLHELTLGLAGGGVDPPRGEPEPCVNVEPLPLVERVLTLREVPMFSRCGIQALVSLAPLVEEVRLSVGETLYRPGELDGVFFVVARGVIETERLDPPAKSLFGQGSLLGGNAALGDAEHRYAARALTEAVLLRVREEDFFDVMEDHFDLARSMFAYLAAERERLMNRLALESPALVRQHETLKGKVKG
jgi:CRP-like cAMP-binding protein